MRLRLIIAGVLLVPVVELAAWIAVAQWLGVGWALLATAATAVVGYLVVRREGRRSMQRLRYVMQTGRMPEDQGSDGALRMFAGIALLAPGFVSDLLGLLLLIPPVRGLARRSLFRRFVRSVDPEAANRMFGPRRVRVRRGEAPPSPSTVPGEVIEGEVVESRTPRGA